MERLLEKLKDLMKQYQITNYNISKNTGISQSHLSMIFGGKRNIKPAQFFAILGQIPLPLDEKNELIHEFGRLYYTENEYLSLKYINEMLKQLSDLTVSSIDSGSMPDKLPRKSRLKFKDTVYRGAEIKMIVGELLIRDFSAKRDIVYMYLPNGGYTAILKNIIDILVQLYDHSTKLVLFVDYLSDEAQKVVNLEALKDLIPIGILDNTDSYCFYSTSVCSPLNDNYTVPYPYFIAFGGNIVFINPACDEIMLHSDAEVVKSVRSRCEGRIKHCKKLVDMNSAVHTMISDVVYSQGNTDSFCSLEYEPCLVMHFTKELVDKVILKDITGREKLVELANVRLKQLQAFKNSVRIFNKDSLMKFAETGRVHELPPEYARSLTPPERFIILKNMLELSKDKNHVLRALNPVNIYLSKRVSMYQSNNFVLFSIWDNEYIPHKYCMLYDRSLCDSFRNFTEFLSQSAFVYTENETQEIIKSAIKYVEDLC